MARAVAAGIPHHVTQRGNQRQPVFHHDADRRLYLTILRDHAARNSLRLLGYCLMTNHVHLIAIPEHEHSLARALGRTHADYARWFHIRDCKTGHLWQNRFYSCPLDAGHCWSALRYVELNPVRAGMVESAWDWPWSSAPAHLAGTDASGFLDTQGWQSCWSAPLWKQALQDGVGDALLDERIRLATRTGRPLGGREFTAALEKSLGRPLAPAKRGRKPKSVTGYPFANFA